MIRLARDGPVARVTLDRPHVLNAGNREWVRHLNAVVAELRGCAGLRVVVVTGAGRAFSAGVDLGALASGEFGLADFIAWEDAMIALEDLDALVLAAINGHCLGGGLQLALACDYRLATEDALIGLPAVKERLIPSLALYRLPRLIGLARAKELILLGQNISARDAERLGVLNRVVPATEFARAVDEMTAHFLALPSTTVIASKRLMRRAFDLSLDEFRREMNAAFATLLDSDDFRAAMAALRERRAHRA